MDWRLANFAVVVGFPFVPVQHRKDFIEDSEGVIFGDAMFECFVKQDELFAGQRCILPIAGFRLSLAHGESFRGVQ